MIKQISVFLENRPGQLRDVTKSIKEKDINIRAITVAETADYGIIRLIVEDPEAAMAILKEKGFLAAFTDVAAVAVTDKPGGLAGLLELLEETDINIEYMYSVFGKVKGEAFMIFKVNDIGGFAKQVEAAGMREAKIEELGR